MAQAQNHSTERSAESPSASASAPASSPASGSISGWRDSFSSALLDPERGVPESVASAPGGGPAVKRFAVYRNNVVVSLVEAVKDAYPSTLAVVGEEGFERVARAYAVAHPPRSPVMMQYGEGFADFLESVPSLREAPFLPDLARVERAWLEAWHAADAEPVDPRPLSRMEGDALAKLRLEAHPAARLVESNYPVADLFARRYGEPQGGVDLERGQCVAVARPALEPVVYAVERGRFLFLRDLLAGKTLGEAGEKAIEKNPEFDLAESLSFVLEAGLCVASESAGESG